MNYNCRRKQAKEFSMSILRNLLKNIDSKKVLYQGNYTLKKESDVDNLLRKITLETKKRAQEIKKDWSIPIIIETIGHLYYGKEQNNISFGTTYKRALVYLWQSNNNKMSCEKNEVGLIEVLELCYVIESLYSIKRVFLFSNDLKVDYCDGYFKCNNKYYIIAKELQKLNQGRGKRLRIAEVNNKLMLEKHIEFGSALDSVLEGQSPKNLEIFKDTFYEEIPGVSHKECRKFWQELNLRHKIFMMACMDNAKKSMESVDDLFTLVNIFPEYLIEVPEGYLTQDIVYSVFWNKDWINSKIDEVYSNLIVERPILRITQDGYFATSPALIGDSINLFVESQIMKYSDRSSKINLPDLIFKKTISEPFENEVIKEFRDRGFFAGHVTERGIWKCQNGNININWSDTEKLYGEIDCLAYSPDNQLVILIECKVLNDVRNQRNYKNLISKIIEDSESFQKKILEKSNWIVSALSNYYKTDITIINAILTDISLPIINFPNDEIIFCCYTKLITAIDNLKDELNIL